MIENFIKSKVNNFLHIMEAYFDKYDYNKT